MQRGKYICEQLKAVRRRIADENGIALGERECTHQGPCRGTCPRCDAEVKYLEQTLAERLRLGRVATVAGLGLTLAACGGQGNAPMVETDGPITAPENTEPGNPSPLHPTEEGGEPFDMDRLEGDVLAEPPTTPPDECPLAQGVVEDTTTTEDLVEGEEGYEFPTVEGAAEFPGGEEALYQFIADNLQYPAEAREKNIVGKVYVTFVVEKDGSITSARLLRDIGGGCGAEALRVVNLMPRWKPGTQSGKIVRSQYTLPIVFNLKD